MDPKQEQEQESVKEILKKEKEKVFELINLKNSLLTDENQKEMEEFLEDISIPRLVGTENEKIVVDKIDKKFEDIGLKLRKYPFWATRYWTDKFIRRSIGFLLVLGFAIAISSTRNLDWTYGFMMIMGIFGIFIYRNLTRPDLPIVGERFKTVNLRTDIPSKNISEPKDYVLAPLDSEEKERSKYHIPKYKKKILRFFDYYEDMLELDTFKDDGVIVLMAHHDSKSQPLKTYIRALFFTTTLLALVTSIVSFLLTTIMERSRGIDADQNPARFIGYVAIIIAIFAAVPLVFNGVGNNSMGAMDNASGVVTVYELAKYFKKNPLENYRIIVLITGSEEVSTLGSRYMAPIIQKEIGEKPTFVFNYDMVGLKNTPVQFIEGSMMSKEIPYLKQLAYDTGSKMFIPVEGFKFVIGAMTDGFIFGEAGFKSIDFVCRSAAFFTHTGQDTPDKFDGLSGMHAVALSAGMMKKIDEEVQKLKKKRRQIPKIKKKKENGSSPKNNLNKKKRLKN